MVSGENKSADGAALTSKETATSRYQYFRYGKRADTKTCEGAGTLRVRGVEASVYGQMCRKMAEFKTVTGGGHAKANPKLIALNIELAQAETEIEKLLDTLMGANATLLNYANRKVEELDTKKQSLLIAIASMRADALSSEKMDQISNYLGDWDNTSFDERRFVVDGLISSIQATSENFQIQWKI